jgi:hypothetical protein
MLLLNAGANPNVGDANGLTPLCAAAQRCVPKIMLSLLYAGADPLAAALGARRQTPLHCIADEVHVQPDSALTGGSMTLLHDMIRCIALLAQAAGSSCFSVPNAAGLTPEQAANTKGSLSPTFRCLLVDMLVVISLVMSDDIRERLRGLSDPCAVCWETEPAKTIACPHCLNSLHVQCAVAWDLASDRMTCPMCRANVRIFVHMQSLSLVLI